LSVLFGKAAYIEFLEALQTSNSPSKDAGKQTTRLLI